MKKSILYSLVIFLSVFLGGCEKDDPMGYRGRPGVYFNGKEFSYTFAENPWKDGASFGPTILLSLFWKRFNYQGAVAGVISGFVIDLGWLLTGMTASTGIFEIVPGFFGSLVVAIIVAKLTSAPNEKAVAIFEQGTSKNAD